MKKVNIALAAGIIGTLAVGQALAGLAGSAHDFTATGGTPIAGVTESCKTCHVPHRPLLNVPLWAHALSSYSYNLYNTNPKYTGPNSAAYDASPSSLAGTKSALCLSCHDGTVAVAGTTYMGNIMGGDSIVTWDNGAPVSGNPNNGLRGSHPIAVNYATVRTNQPSDYNDISADPAVKLEASKVQCTSCHNPHNKVAGTMMLVKANTNSALCVTCHNK